MNDNGIMDVRESGFVFDKNNHLVIDHRPPRITKKQIGVIYRAVKLGKIFISKEIINHMYTAQKGNLSEFNYKINDQCYEQLREIVNLIFEEKYEAAVDAIDKWNRSFGKLALDIEWRRLPARRSKRRSKLPRCDMDEVIFCEYGMTIDDF